MTEYLETDIAIIGAGLAGLTAAYRLHEKGFQAHVFEARPRVGGRVHTVRIKNLEGGYSFAELGGQNINDGGDATHIIKLMRDLKVPFDQKCVNYTRLFFDGTRIHDPSSLFQKYRKHFPNFEELYSKIPQDAQTMEDILARLFEDDPLLRRVLTFQLAGYEGSPPENLAIYHNAEDLFYMLQGGMAQSYVDDKQDVRVNRIIATQGNGTIPLMLAKALDGYVHLNKILTCVQRKKEQKRNKLVGNEVIELLFQDGMKVHCDKVVLAMPCSVLKDIEIDLSLLTENKQKDFYDVQYGTNGKIMVPVNLNEQHYTMLMTDHMGAFFNQDERLFNLYYVKEQGSTLKTYFGKRFKEALSSLKKAFPKSILQDALPVVARDHQFDIYDVPVVKSWAEDPFSKGSYSNYGNKLGEKLAASTYYKTIPIRTLFEPVDDCLFFAGEHTTMLDEIGTMEAAVESGERASHMIQRSFAYSSMD